jgi:hypothetical protein
MGGEETKTAPLASDGFVMDTELVAQQADLANFVPDHVDHLAAAVIDSLAATATTPDRLRAFVRHCGLTP